MQALSDDLCHFPQGENYTLNTWLRGGGIFFVEIKKKKCFADFTFFNLKNIFKFKMFSEVESFKFKMWGVTL